MSQIITMDEIRANPIYLATIGASGMSKHVRNTFGNAYSHGDISKVHIAEIMQTRIKKPNHAYAYIQGKEKLVPQVAKKTIGDLEMFMASIGLQLNTRISDRPSDDVEFHAALIAARTALAIGDAEFCTLLHATNKTIATQGAAAFEDIFNEQIVLKPSVVRLLNALRPLYKEAGEEMTAGPMPERVKDLVAERLEASSAFLAKFSRE